MIKHIKERFRFLLIFIILETPFLFLLKAYAKESNDEDNLSSDFTSYAKYVPSHSVKSQAGNIELIQSGAEYSYKFKVFEELPIGLSVGSEYIGIKNTTKVELPAHLTRASFGVETTLPFFNLNRTYLHIELNPSFYGDDWDFGTANFNLQNRYVVVYQPNKRWTFLAGVDIYPHYVYPVLHTYPVSPIAGFIYKPNDRLEFRITPDNANVSYLITDRLTLFAEESDSIGGYSVSVNDKSRKILKYSQASLGAGVKYKINKFIDASFAAGDVFYQLLKYKDDSGKVASKNGIYTEFKIEVRI